LILLSYDSGSRPPFYTVVGFANQKRSVVLSQRQHETSPGQSRKENASNGSGYSSGLEGRLVEMDDREYTISSAILKQPGG
jgi:hypothetical protein